jgi:serine/threonine protein kinase
MELEIDFEYGLERLRTLVSQQPEAIQQMFASLEARLLVNLSERRYGHDTNNAASRNRLIHELDTFLHKDLRLSIQFIDMCKIHTGSLVLPEDPQTQPQPVSAQPLTLWQAGDHVLVQGQTYWIDGPIYSQWLDHKSALYLQAPGKAEHTGQAVCLKQCQIAHAHDTALTLLRDLEKEGRLLLKLQQAGQRDFPRLLGSERIAQRYTLVYEKVAGRTLASVCAGLARPLDLQTTKRLLAGRRSLVQMLHALHTVVNCSHRMLTPETLLVHPHSNRIVLLDVGLAARTLQPGEGPQLYQAPEQVRGLPVPGRHTDIYQLGALFYHILTGTTRKPGETTPTANLPLALDNVLRKATALHPKDRWPDIYAFSQALRQSGY